MSTSKLQRQTSTLLGIHLGQHTIRENHRPEWLDGLELDFYIEELNVGIEVQGQQHFEYTPYFHGSYTDFLAQKDRDARKLDICQHRGIEIYYVESSEDILPLVEKLTGIELPERLHANYLKHVEALYEPKPFTKKQRRQRASKNNKQFLKLYAKVGLACKVSDWETAKDALQKLLELVGRNGLILSDRHKRKVDQWNTAIETRENPYSRKIPELDIRLEQRHDHTERWEAHAQDFPVSRVADPTPEGAIFKLVERLAKLGHIKYSVQDFHDSN